MGEEKKASKLGWANLISCSLSLAMFCFFCYTILFQGKMSSELNDLQLRMAIAEKGNKEANEKHGNSNFDIFVQNFTKTEIEDILKVDVVEALQEFWLMKSSRHGTEAKKMEILYEHEAHRQAPFVCYVTLPGGSCFGSFQYCLTKAEAQRSAAKIALMNSVFNEHPSRLINDAFIEQAVMEAKSINANVDDTQGIETFRFMLIENKGNTMLEFQALMTIFRLLQWNDSFKKMRDSGLARNEVIVRYLHRQLDGNIRNEMAKDWAVKSRNENRKLEEELATAKEELQQFRLAGRELRFFKEKQDILSLALINSSQV